MNARSVLAVSGVALRGVYSCLPSRSVDNLACCTDLFGDAVRARNVVSSTGIVSRRIADGGTTSLDLCVQAAARLLDDLRIPRSDVGAVIQVTFTPAQAMPCNACQAQARLGLGKDVIAFDMGLACSGWLYGLHVAALLVKSTGRKVLLLDGDVQTAHVGAADRDVLPLLADAGTATLLVPSDRDETWKFAFMSDGARGAALELPVGGRLGMDGFGVFKFVSTDVLHFIRDFMATVGLSPERVEGFVPHQANMFMVRQLAKSLKIGAERVWTSGDVFGNSASATVPTTIAYRGAAARDVPGAEALNLLVAGFGGGLSASVGQIVLPRTDCPLKVFDYQPPQEKPL
ncbi:MAG: ketoacyl-ACP synthase III [Kiritimatiellia bacterium]